MAEQRLLVDRREAARMLSVSVSTVKNLQRRGELRAVHIGAAVRFRVADVETFIERKAAEAA